MKLSIIICTTGEREEIVDCINSLSSYKEVEVIIVNNSSKNISIDTNFKIINEKKIGLSFARNTGWKKAKGEYVAYIDDDSISDKDWIKNILLFIQKNPQVEAFGGPYNRHSNKKIPSWMPSNFGLLNNGNKQRKLNIGSEWLSGTNMIFKRELLKKHKGFNTSLGMSGEKISYGEEIDLQIRLASSGVGIWYDPKIKVSHLLDERKMNIFWIIKDSFIRGKSNQLLKASNLSIHKINKRQLVKDGESILQKTVRFFQYVFYGLGAIYERIVG